MRSFWCYIYTNCHQFLKNSVEKETIGRAPQNFLSWASGGTETWKYCVSYQNPLCVKLYKMQGTTRKRCAYGSADDLKNQEKPSMPLQMQLTAVKRHHNDTAQELGRERGLLVYSNGDRIHAHVFHWMYICFVWFKLHRCRLIQVEIIVHSYQIF